MNIIFITNNNTPHVNYLRPNFHLHAEKINYTSKVKLEFPAENTKATAITSCQENKELSTFDHVEVCNFRKTNATKSISMCFYLHSSKNCFKPFSNILLKGNYEYGTSISGKFQVTKSARQFKRESRVNKHNLKTRTRNETGMHIEKWKNRMFERRYNFLTEPNKRLWKWSQFW